MKPAPARRAHLELRIEGMTCASCAARVERRLNGVDGVTASVNYATERAAVAYDPAHTSAADLVAAVDAAGYTARLPESADAAAETDTASVLRRRVLSSVALGLPVLAVSMVPALQFTFWQWIALAFATPVVLWAGWPFHLAAWKNLQHGTATMDTLVSLGTLAAWGWSVVALFFLDAGATGMKMPFELVPRRAGGGDRIYLEVASVVIAFLLTGRLFEARAKRRAGSALRALGKLGAKRARVLGADGRERLVAIDQLRVGELFVVRPGEKVATDGVVVEGRSAIDASLLTGESMPVEVGPGDSVPGATINAGGRLLVRAQRVGSDTALARIAQLVTDAQTGKAPVQRLADRVSGVFVPVVIAAAVGTFGLWAGSGAGWTFAFSAAVAVLIVACPCALGLATPTALLVGTGRGAQLGILIKGPAILESTRRVDTVVLDKTGTITEGTMTLVRLVSATGTEDADALRLVGALEHASEHPVARAIAAAALVESPRLPGVESFANRPGLGVEGSVEGHVVVAGRPALLAEWGVELDDELAAVVAEAQSAGMTPIVGGWDGSVRAVFVVSDVVKPGAAEAVRQLQRLGLRPVLLTGDNDRAARAVASAVGIHDVIAEVLPAEKAAHVEALQAEGAIVAMVGDGVNDAPALAQADLGIALGTGADVAIEAADLTLVSGDLRSAADAIRLSRQTLSTIKGNLFWAFAYNVAALPLAAAGFLNPVLAGGAMALSSVFVVSNSLRLRRFAVRREPVPPTGS